MAKKYRVIELTQGFVAIIDATDYRKVKRHAWHTHFSAGKRREKGEPYARATINKKKVYLHRFLVQAPADMHVDHINNVTLDYRRNNLRITTVTQNLHNRRGYERKQR